MITITPKNRKIINDPLHGFIFIPSEKLFALIQHPIFQRLRRISQLGLSYLVYPGANHTRFAHSLGCLHLMQHALDTLINKGIVITEEEYEAACIAILLHDIGHGPYSHALEESLIDIHHEAISLKLFEQLNHEMNGELSLALQIFTATYSRPFFNQLIASQLDVDRLDYLMRDSFYTGVTEGKISIDRLISMMYVVNDELVIETKGIYSVENFIIARQFMYWQVYLHKTNVGAELLLTNILKRAKIVMKKQQLFCTPELAYFLQQDTIQTLDEQSLANFLQLSDGDILISIRQWCENEDKTLSFLSKMLINRKLYKSIELHSNEKKETVLENKKINAQEINNPYFLSKFKVQNLAYNKNIPIKLVNKQGELVYLHKISQQLDFQQLTKPISKRYLFYVPQNEEYVL